MESLIKIIILAVVQGLAELLPVSSSAHVIVAEKLLGMDPSTPEMTLLLVMLHTGTMFAVILYFWRAWKKSLFASRAVFKQQAVRLLLATILTGIIYLGIVKGVEKAGYLAKDANGHAEIESLFGNLGLIAGALFAAGVLILIAGLAGTCQARQPKHGHWDSRGRMDRRRPRTVYPVPRVFTFRGDDFHRHAAGRSQGAGGGIQLRSGSHPYPTGHLAHGVSVRPRPSRSLEFPRDLEPIRSWPHRHGVRFPGWFAGPEVALALVGGWPLVSFRRLLSGGCGSRLRPPLLWVLTVGWTSESVRKRP